jgi:hypothetical protein
MTATENGALRVSLKYCVATGEKPSRAKAGPEDRGTERVAEYAQKEAVVRDARRADEAFSIDRQGFMLVPHETGAADLYDPATVRDVYYREVEALVRRVSGAARVLAFDHTLRSTAPERREIKIVRGPAQRMHNDYTERSGPQRVRDLLPAEAEILLRRRVAIINVWRPIRGPLQTAPLALCDARSVAMADLIASELIYPDRVGETYGLAYSPRHRLFYFPAMQRTEALLIKCYDSDGGRARFTPHGSFDDPMAPIDALPRESIEVRSLAFF